MSKVTSGSLYARNNRITNVQNIGKTILAPLQNHVIRSFRVNEHSYRDNT